MKIDGLKEAVDASLREIQDVAANLAVASRELAVPVIDKRTLDAIKEQNHHLQQTAKVFNQIARDIKP